MGLLLAALWGLTFALGPAWGSFYRLLGAHFRARSGMGPILSGPLWTHFRAGSVLGFDFGPLGVLIFLLVLVWGCL